eukprot:3068235-Rhodomonas_salina.2
MAAGQEEATAFTALLEGSRLESCYEIFVNGGIKNVDAFKGLSKEKIDALGLKPIQQQKVAKALHELEEIANQQKEAEEKARQQRPKQVPKCVNGHELVYKGRRPSGWACDRRRAEAGCMRGCTGFYESGDWDNYRCDRCDWDLCDLCYAAEEAALE